MTAAGFNNDVAQQNYTNAYNNAGFNNQTAQQNFQNRATIVDQNNNAGNMAFQNAMAAVGQRNQVQQNSFAALQSTVAQHGAARQTDLGNVQSYLGLQPIASQGNQLGGLQNGGAVGFNPGGGYNSTGVNSNAGDNGAQWSGQLYGANMQSHAARMQADAARAAAKTSANGANTGAAIAGAAVIAAAFICKVAREVYGEDARDWRIFRVWLLTQASNRRVERYRIHGAKIAAWLKNRPDWKARVRRWMDAAIAKQRKFWSSGYVVT